MIITFLDDLKDHRRSQGQRYELRFIVLFSIMAILVLSFFDTQSELILAHETIDVKTNEIPVAQALIPQLGLEGAVYALDALHCQKKTFEIADNENIEEKKLIIQVKDNQKGTD